MEVIHFPACRIFHTEKFALPSTVFSPELILNTHECFQRVTMRIQGRRTFILVLAKSNRATLANLSFCLMESLDSCSHTLWAVLTRSFREGVCMHEEENKVAVLVAVFGLRILMMRWYWLKKQVHWGKIVDLGTKYSLCSFSLVVLESNTHSVCPCRNLGCCHPSIFVQISSWDLALLSSFMPLRLRYYNES